MKIIAFAASNSETSINKMLATYAAGLVDGANVEVLDLNDFELPIYSPKREAELGQPEEAAAFRAKLASADAIIVSFAEHNSNYTAAYKNLFDWCSRIDRNIYADKPMILLATSPGARGATSVLELAKGQIPRFGGDVKGTFSLPNFNDNFDTEKKLITHDEYRDQLLELVKKIG